MKVILLKDVAKLGRKFDVKDVADGFARNSLLPRGLAELATSGALAKIEKQKSADDSRREAVEGGLLAELDRLAETTLTFVAKANEAGHLFAGLKQEDILSLLREQGYHFTEENLHFVKPIKETGTHNIPVMVGKKEGRLTFVVTAV